MLPIAYESGNRRAEIEAGHVVFLRVTGDVRRSKKRFWYVACKNSRKAKAMALRWVNHGKMSKAPMA